MLSYSVLVNHITDDSVKLESLRVCDNCHFGTIIVLKVRKQVQLQDKVLDCFQI